MGDDEQRADLPAGAQRRRVEAGEGGGELIELARRLELVLPSEGVQQAMAHLTLLIAVGLDKAQVDVLPATLVHRVPLDVRARSPLCVVGPTLYHHLHVLQACLSGTRGTQATSVGPTDVSGLVLRIRR